MGWLKARHHFAIGGHGNPIHKPLGNLIVWNDDEIASGKGFPMHGHRDIEIITYVRQGIVTHQDNIGNEGQTKAGDVQVMSAGTGIMHSELNTENVPTKLFQIWLQPRTRGGVPRWGTKPFPKNDRAGCLEVLASGFEDDPNALFIRADARVLGATLAAGQALTYTLDHGRNAYLVPAYGSVKVNGVDLATGDGAAVSQESVLRIEATDDAEFVLVDAS